jgi:hypothetical protein
LKKLLGTVRISLVAYVMDAEDPRGYLVGPDHAIWLGRRGYKPSQKCRLRSRTRHEPMKKRSIHGEYVSILKRLATP